MTGARQQNRRKNPRGEGGKGRTHAEVHSVLGGIQHPEQKEIPVVERRNTKDENKRQPRSSGSQISLFGSYEGTKRDRAPTSPGRTVTTDPQGKKTPNGAANRERNGQPLARHAQLTRPVPCT